MGTPGDPQRWPDGVPDLPPEWGPIVIPDDPAELAAEARLVREELRRQAQRRGHDGAPGNGLTDRSPARAPGGGEPTSLRLALIIMAVAVLTTLTSLLAIALPGPRSQPQGRREPPDRTAPPHPLPALDVVDARGSAVALRGLPPAVIMLPARCACTEQITATAAAAPAGVTVVTLTSRAGEPSPAPTPATGAPVRALADPAGELRDHLNIAPTPGTATVVLVGAGGDILRVLPASTSVEEYRADLELLSRD